MIIPDLIKVFSTLWWMGIIISIIVSFIILQLAIRIPPDRRRLLMILLGLFMIFLEAFQQYYLIDLKLWNIKTSLPIHLCGIAGIIAGIILIRPEQKSFEFLALMGTPGALHALLTPQLNHGGTNFLIFEYYASHTGIILTPLFLAIVLGYRINENSWFSVFLICQVLLIFIGLSNYLIGSNYMYLSNQPLANNPMIVGSWPWYILGFEILGFIHIYIFYKFYRFMKPIQY
tara:strand:- start:1035 stop:1727 length:693 start_codon:yes stop_codon:yes gene_type:complete